MTRREDVPLKSHPVPKVGDTVHLNRHGLETIYGSPTGKGHMKTLLMKITEVDKQSMTAPVLTFNVSVDNPEIDQFLISHWCFDIVQRAEYNYPSAVGASNVHDDLLSSDEYGCAVERSNEWGSF